MRSVFGEALHTQPCFQSRLSAKSSPQWEINPLSSGLDREPSSADEAGLICLNGSVNRGVPSG
ncbi:hypothetical protein JAAARDRAFT_38557 [Jaapia argillacea MUCL 33604]|uniref:Uncharacterized protein n=1 Tax=Jaapia argillacea MUCL 33604 TaxID=933084 RepID=A0A067PVP1_9AGAM|nr:hypothetical protein JAAARDRAFT_38557 [Jaapia argillacea MUCL 33604]